MSIIEEPQSYALDEAHERARQRVVAKRDFERHLVTFVVVNVLVVVTWAVTGAGYFWPAWMIGLWGIGLLFHGWDVWRPITEREIDAEMLRQGDRHR